MPGGLSMWVVVHMARSQEGAEKARACLAREGVLVRLHPIYRALSQQDNYFEIQVLQSEVQEARAILLEHGM